MHRLARFALAVSLLGCAPQRLRPALPPGVRVDTYVQQAASKIDVLWVVDNSGSMAPRQENLARNFQTFIDTLARSAVDYRLAVTTTDIFREAGSLVGSPAVLTPQTPQVAAAFSNNVRVGTSGSPYEVGMEAARRAIDRQNAANENVLRRCLSDCPTGDLACEALCRSGTTFDFLRRDAWLSIIFVSDEDDKSSQDVHYFHRSFETAKGIGNDAMVTTAAIMGDVPSNSCGATPGLKYQALSDLTGGTVGSICDPSFADSLKKLASNAVGLRRKFVLQLLPNVDTLAVTLRYPCNASPEQLRHCTRVDRAHCADSPSDSRNLWCTPQQGGPDGWSYEAGTNVIFFAGESVPGVTADIDIQYSEEGFGQ